METKTKIVLLLNLVFVALLLSWPVVTAPKFKISLNKDTVPLGGELRFTVSFPSPPSSVRVDVVDLERNMTIESKSLQPSKVVSATIPIDEGSYRIGHYSLRVVANLGSTVEEDAYFNVFGGAPLNITLETEENLSAFINVTAEKQYTTVSSKVYATVKMEGKPVKGAKLIALTMGPNATVTSVTHTDSEGKAVLDWSANVTDNTTYVVVVQALKPGHPIASGEVKIRVRVEKGS